MSRLFTVLMFVIAFLCEFAQGAITPYYDKQTWMDAVASHTTITFQEFPSGTWVSDQYADLGITFDLTANVYSQIQAQPWFLNDGMGLMSFGLSTSPVVRFAEPRYAIAVDTPIGAVNFWLFYEGVQVGSSSVTNQRYFAGIVSTLPFDTVLSLPTGIDDLHFGPPVPAPGALALLGIAAAIGQSRRRRK